MDDLPTPHLIVLNATTSEHHIPEDDPMQLTPEAIHLFLESIHEQKAQVYRSCATSSMSMTNVSCLFPIDKGIRWQFVVGSHVSHVL